MHLVCLNDDFSVVLGEKMSVSDLRKSWWAFGGAKGLSLQIAFDEIDGRSVNTTMDTLVPNPSSLCFHTLVTFDSENTYHKEFETFDEAIGFHHEACGRLFGRNGTLVYQGKKLAH